LARHERQSAFPSGVTIDAAGDLYIAGMKPNPQGGGGGGKNHQWWRQPFSVLR
jgi:hypothetical protein